MASQGLSAASGALSGAAAGTTIAPGIGTAIGGVIGGLAGLLGGGGDDDAAQQAYQNAVDQYTKMGNPPDMAKALALQDFKQAGILTPELQEKLTLNSDKQTNLVEDPNNKGQQQYALDALKQMSQTGLTAQDRAAFNQLRDQTAADTQAKTNQILQQQQMQGKASGGNALAAQLASIQGSNQNASSEADRLAAQATQARSSALANFTNLAGQMRNTDLGTQQFNTQNEIARQRFLDQNSLSRQQANVNTINAANQANLQRQQSVSDANTASQNQELNRQVQAQQQMWVDKLAKANGMAGVYEKQAGNDAKQAANQAASNQSMITSGLGAIKDLGASGMFKTSPSGTPSIPGAAPSSGSTVLATPVNGMATGGVVPTKNSFDRIHALLSPDKHSEPVGAVPVNSTKNDTVPAMLSPGEIVIPKSFAHDKGLSKAYIDYLHKKEKESPSEPKANYATGGIVVGKSQFPGDKEMDATPAPIMASNEKIMPRSPGMKKEKGGHQILSSLSSLLKDLHEIKS